MSRLLKSWIAEAGLSPMNATPRLRVRTTVGKITVARRSQRPMIS
jgi:hypothetical protein